MNECALPGARGHGSTVQQTESLSETLILGGLDLGRSLAHPRSGEEAILSDDRWRRSEQGLWEEQKAVRGLWTGTLLSVTLPIGSMSTGRDTGSMPNKSSRKPMQSFGLFRRSTFRNKIRPKMQPVCECILPPHSEKGRWEYWVLTAVSPLVGVFIPPPTSTFLCFHPRKTVAFFHLQCERDGPLGTQNERQP